MEMQPREELWRVWAEDVSHGAYLVGGEKSEFAVPLIAEIAAGLDSSILELGCNVGRNLEHLRRAG